MYFENSATERTENEFWPNPKAKSVGQFTDFRLYYEALEVISVVGVLNSEMLSNLLPERIKGLKLILSFKTRTYKDLFRELSLFGYVQKVMFKDGYFQITPEGRSALMLYNRAPDEFLNELLKKMQEVFVTPGWLLHRLWELNPKGQGMIVIPSPVKEWKPRARDWKSSGWDEELSEICHKTIEVINKKSPNALPIEMNKWVKMIQQEYLRMGSKRTLNIENSTEEATRKAKLKFSPRMRLTLAMKTVTIKYLFANENPLTGKKDFRRIKSPLDSRSFMVWCPRLEYTGLLFYTDYNRDIPGRIVFPTCVYAGQKKSNLFSKLEFMEAPNSEKLFLYTPMYNEIREDFLMTLYETYQRIYNRDEIIYVSIQEVRDETCRILRISAALFEKYLEKIYRESVQRIIPLAISLETDIRGDQKNAYQIVRRPVVVNNVPHSLIAIKQY